MSSLCSNNPNGPLSKTNSWTPWNTRTPIRDALLEVIEARVWTTTINEDRNRVNAGRILPKITVESAEDQEVAEILYQSDQSDNDEEPSWSIMDAVKDMSIMESPLTKSVPMQNGTVSPTTNLKNEENDFKLNNKDIDHNEDIISGIEPLPMMTPPQTPVGMPHAMLTKPLSFSTPRRTKRNENQILDI